MIQNIEDLSREREKAVAEMNGYDCRVLVCSGTGCIATGSNKIYQLFKDLIGDDPSVQLEFAPHDEDAHDSKVGVHKTGCQGFCELGPLVRIQKGGKTVQYVKVQPDDCKDIYEETILGDNVLERLLYHKGEKKYVQPEEIPFIAKQTRIVLENCGKLDAESLDEYLASGGFKALEKAMFQMDRDQIIEEIDKSGLRGRGGGGFPAGKKWKQVARQKDPIRYVVCNGDEGDPGAFMDGSVMEGDPFKLIEGMMIAAYAVRSSDGYIYVRAEYPMSVARLRHAIALLEERGLLGDQRRQRQGHTQGQQIGLGHNAGIGGGVGDDAVGQTRCQQDHHRHIGPVPADGEDVHQLSQLGIGHGNGVQQLFRPLSQGKYRHMGQDPRRQAHGGADPGPQDDARHQLNGQGGQDNRHHLHEGQQPKEAGAVDPPLPLKASLQGIAVAAGKCRPDPRGIQPDKLHHQANGHQNHEGDHRQRDGSRSALLFFHGHFSFF